MPVRPLFIVRRSSDLPARPRGASPPRVGAGGRAQSGSPGYQVDIFTSDGCGAPSLIPYARVIAKLVT